MEQLLIHLWGDYILQTDWMASQKRKNPSAAILHAFVYTLPFLLLTHSIPALAMIMLTHFFIDWLGLARYVVFAKNWVTDPSSRWADCSATGYHKDRPVWLATWLLIITDNALHLTINYASLRWL
jgi:hypothetical protein